MDTAPPFLQTALKVCLNGHVVAADSAPGTCDRCGDAYLDRCQTCGQRLLAPLDISGLVPLGQPQAPQRCPTCRATFPWSERPSTRPSDPLAVLENLLRRLPLVARQLRWRQTDRPPFRIEDERDLEDMLRALLPLHFDQIRLESRTPSYSPGTRTDLLLASPQIAISSKCVRPGISPEQLAGQVAEDAAYYWRNSATPRTLVVLVYDPENRLTHPRAMEQAWSRGQETLDVLCWIVS
jgi:hypothetical protein